jgi:hypothetical protein
MIKLTSPYQSALRSPVLAPSEPNHLPPTAAAEREAP